MVIIDKPLPLLHKELREIEKQLEEKEPLLYRAMMFYRDTIALKESANPPSEISYADLAPWPAIKRCLAAYGPWMSKRAIIRELVAGGQVKDKENGVGLLNDAINHQLKPHVLGLVTRDGKKLERGDKSMDTEVGFPGTKP